LTEVVGVRFKSLGKIYYFDPEGFSIPAGTEVVVETARGLEYGKAVLGNRDVNEKAVVQPLRKVTRLATDEDREKMLDAKEKEEQARAVCMEKIVQRQLPMKLVEVEYSFDGSKVLFYFTAEGRVDFRELVKDLASIFKTRIELRQIGVRDEAKMLGGLGSCGRELCCASFLSDFEPVSIRMAKEQNLSLNPSKISGICGRLMCCLKYESQGYESGKKGKDGGGGDKELYDEDFLAEDDGDM
jgi:cell fate regulator YaaT (PSP1 superfamily)